jgi:ribosome maturation factor RimP
VRVVYPEKEDISGHVFEDPDVGTDNEYFTEEDELLDFEQYDEETEYEILKANMPEEFDEATGEPLPPREPRSREERAIEIEEEWTNRWLDEPMEEKPADGMFSHPVDTKALSVVSQAIITALEDENVEKKLQILSRHDVVLTSPLDNPCILDSQKEFDAARDLDVYVETRDPWGSNRVLGGKLVDRNAMDVIINQDNSGRMVTIPNSMVHQVLLPSGLAKGNARMRAALDAEDDEDEDDEEDWDVEEADIDEEEFLE